MATTQFCTGTQLFDLNVPAIRTRWDAYVSSHPLSTPFHHSRWLGIIEATYRFTPLYYARSSNIDGFKWIFPLFYINNLPNGRRLVSLPFSDYGGPLAQEDVPLSEVFREIILACPPARFIESRNRYGFVEGWNQQYLYKRHIIDLSRGLNRIYDDLDKRTTCYSIRKAQRTGVVVNEENTPEGLKAFIRLNLMTRYKHGVPVQPRRFFEVMYRRIIADGHGFILVARVDRKPIAAGLFLKWNQTLYYKYSASDPKQLRLYSPNHLITWTAMEKGVHEGFTAFDFGRTSMDNEGLMRFKESWGATCYNLPYAYFPQACKASSQQEGTAKYRALTELWHKIPSGLVPFLSNLIYQRLA
jgi:hypothetical protein